MRLKRESSSNAIALPHSHAMLATLDTTLEKETYARREADPRPPPRPAGLRSRAHPSVAVIAVATFFCRPHGRGEVRRIKERCR